MLVFFSGWGPAPCEAPPSLSGRQAALPACSASPAPPTSSGGPSCPRSGRAASGRPSPGPWRSTFIELADLAHAVGVLAAPA